MRNNERNSDDFDLDSFWKDFDITIGHEDVLEFLDDKELEEDEDEFGK